MQHDTTTPTKQFHTCRRCFTTKPISEFRLREKGKYPESFCKPCKSEQRREWKERNRDRVRETDRAWAKRNPEKTKAARDRYRARHAEEIRRRDRERYWSNRDALLAYQRQWRKKIGRRRINQYMRKWRTTNPESYRAHKTRDHQRRRAAGPLFTTKEWRDLVAKYDYTCLCCGRREPDIRLSADHVIPVTKGGSNEIGNIQPLCKSCNSKKRTRTTDFRLRPYAQASLLPLLEQCEDR